MVSIPELRAHLGPHPERFTYALQGDRLLALVEAVEYAYRGDSEQAALINDNYLCLVCKAWSHGSEENHKPECPGSKFSFEAAAGVGEQ